MKHILLLFLSLLFAIGAAAQYTGIEINATDKNSKDCRGVAYTANKVYYYWSSKSDATINAYDWQISYAENGRPESIKSGWRSNTIKSVPGSNFLVSQDDGTMVAKGEGDSLHLYDLVTMERTKILALGDIDDFEISGDGSFLAVALDGKVDLIDVASEKVIQTIPAAADELKFSPGDQFLALIRSQEVEVFNLWSGEFIKLEDLGFVMRCNMSVNGRIIIPHKSLDVWSYDVFDMRSGEKLRKTIKKETDDWYHYSIHPRGDVIQVLGDFYNLKSKKPFFIAYSSRFNKVKFHPFLPGVYVPTSRTGDIGTYFFND